MQRFYPLNFNIFTKIVSGYVDEISQLADKLREEVQIHNKLVTKGIYDIVSNPSDNFKSPELKEEVPFFNFAPIENALSELKKQSVAFEQVSKKGVQNSNNTTALNRVLKDMEHSLTRDQGLPRRIWFKHHIYAPGFYTGYGVKTLPGVREAIEQSNFKEVEEQVKIIAEVLMTFSKKIEEAVKLMK